MSAFNDKFIPLESINSNLSERLKELIKSPKPYKTLNDYFEKFFLDKEVESYLLKAIDIIKLSCENIAVGDLCKKVDIHQKN